MARRNAMPGDVPAGKWSPKQGETQVCALHKLPISEKKGKKFVRAAGETKLVDCTYFVCPAGCCDPHVEVNGDQTTPVVGLTAWKRTAKIAVVDANLAEFKKDKAGTRPDGGWRQSQRTFSRPPATKAYFREAVKTVKSETKRRSE